MRVLKPFFNRFFLSNLLIYSVRGSKKSNRTQGKGHGTAPTPVLPGSHRRGRVQPSHPPPPHHATGSLLPDQAARGRTRGVALPPPPARHQPDRGRTGPPPERAGSHRVRQAGAAGGRDAVKGRRGGDSWRGR